MARRRPPAPDPKDLRPPTETWKAGRPIVHVYHRRWGAKGFNPTDTAGRFRPVRTRSGNIVPTAYGASDVETALAEGLLRGVEALEEGHRRRLYRKEVEGLSMATLLPKVDLVLAKLHGPGLVQLEVTRSQLIDCRAAHYPYTAEWAQALYHCPTKLFGIVWTARQNDSGRAMVLWKGLVRPKSHLTIEGSPTALDKGRGLDLVRQACAYANIDFEG